ncbi:hypothetical protein [Streptomyces griseoaurantiacus]|uniref:hypothetical protein n=1 Tax=Streptomyces griseoaurantiacus TaxID=68213 RepID=UPI0036427C32
MTSALLAVIAAILGMAGTLLAPVLSQRTQAKALAADFDRQQRALLGEWQRDRSQTEFEKRRACYVATNAAFRRYRVELMNYLWDIRRGGASDAAQQQLEEARHAHHAANAESQMIASDEVLDHLDRLSNALGNAYRRIKDLEEGNPGPNGSFEEIEADLRQFWRRWEEMRSVMRADLGASGRRAGPAQAGPG